jgi:hypothetical protein
MLEHWLFGDQSLFFWGFWGMGLLDFFLPLSLVENFLYSVSIFFRAEHEHRSLFLLFRTSLISIICTPLAFIWKIDGPQRLLLLAITVFWSWYFVFIPQIILRAVLHRIELKSPPKRRLICVLVRILLTVVLPIGLITAHAIVGNLVFGITPD